MAIFIFITAIYYTIPTIGKLGVSLEQLTSIDGVVTFAKDSNIRLAVYLATVILTQFIINIAYVVNTCGNLSNSGSVFLLTFLPWTFMFGAMLIMLILYPGFKSAFADVIGYFVVASNANDVLSKILISDAGTQIEIDKLQDPTIKKNMTTAAESIIKMLGNKAIIINQITPLNFINTWDTLKQLMKPGATTDDILKKELLDISVSRDNIGEAMWFVYTGILIISYTSYKITSATCTTTGDIQHKKVIKPKAPIIPIPSTNPTLKTPTLQTPTPTIQHTQTNTNPTLKTPTLQTPTLQTPTPTMPITPVRQTLQPAGVKQSSHILQPTTSATKPLVAKTGFK